MEVVGGELEEIKFTVSECALHLKGEHGSCTPPEIKSKISSAIVRIGSLEKSLNVRRESVAEGDDFEKVKKLLNVRKESELYNHPIIINILGKREAEKALKYYFKAQGPTKSTALLDNFNIDNTLELWATHSVKLFGKRFYHIPFQMIDFMEKNTELARVDLKNLIDQGYDCFGVVLNTDVSTGRGKHWFCIYGELSPEKVTIEFFNSSGRPPMDPVREWIEKTAIKLRKDGIEVDEVRAVDKQLQKSNTECGMWSLMYILLRLKGKPSSWFFDARANDKEMIALRKYIFRE